MNVKLVSVLLFIIAKSEGADVKYPDYQCLSTQYYNPIILDCSELADGYEESNGAQSCSSTFQLSYTDISSDDELEFDCQQCSDDEMVSEYNDRCIACPDAVPLEDGKCDCNFETQILVDTELNGSSIAAECVSCEDEHEPGFHDEYGIPRKCVKCQNTNCKCEYNAGYCFPTGYLANKFVDVTVDSFDSKLLEDNLKGVKVLCEIGISNQRNNITACQVLANFCTLLHSSFSSNLQNLDCTSRTCDSCELLAYTTYSTYQGQTSFYPLWPGWFERVPWLFYNYVYANNFFSSNTDILTEEIEQFYTFETGYNTSQLDVQVISYTLEGDASPIESLSGHLTLCSTVELPFGTTLAHTCTLSIAELSEYATVFHELYLRVSDTLVPIPVLVENSQTNIGEEDDWVLSRRYFLVDSQLGTVSSDDGDNSKFVRYASKLSLSVTVMTEGSKGNIYMPLLRVSYEDVETTVPKQTVTMTFDVTYTKKSENLDEDIGIAVLVVAFLSLVFAVIKTVGYRRRNNILEDCSCRTMACFVLFLFNGLGACFFWVMAGTSWYFLVIYKGQRAVSVLLPLDDSPIRAVLISGFILVLLSRLYFLFRSTSYDICFLDWEKPKGKFIPSSTTTKDRETLTSVSIWRTYFLANEWNELHTIRKINPTFQYIAFLFFTEYVGLKYLTTSQPAVFLDPTSVNYVSEFNTVLRIGLIMGVFFGMWVVQRVYNFLHERFISDQLQMYIDLCSISNVSVFILSDSVYGYYIHGRSVHGHADADMREIVTSLKREEENLCSKRGLGTDSEQQTFDMVIPILLRTNYTRIMLPVMSRDITQRNNRGTEVERQITAYNHINRLFCSFIDRSLDDIDYTIGEKLLLEKVLDMEIREPPPGKGMLYHDDGQSFEDVLYYGNEWLLFMWEVMLVVMVDYTATNFILAAVVAWLINEILLNKLSTWRCQKNVAAKALIDDRFLL